MLKSLGFTKTAISDRLIVRAGNKLFNASRAPGLSIATRRPLIDRVTRFDERVLRTKGGYSSKAIMAEDKLKPLI